MTCIGAAVSGLGFIMPEQVNTLQIPLVFLMMYNTRVVYRTLSEQGKKLVALRDVLFR